MSGLRAAQKRMTRDLFMSTALDLFQTKGYSATTIDDIATSAGTTRATFYLHFSSKSDLMGQLIIDVNKVLVGADSPTLTEVVRAGDRQLIRGWLTRKMGQWPEIKPYVVAANEAAAIEPEIALARKAWFDEPIAEIQRGLDLADRFEPSSRKIRGVLAFGEVEFFSRRLFGTGWDVDEATALDVLTDSWCSLLTEEASGQKRSPRAPRATGRTAKARA